MNHSIENDPFADALESYWRTGHGRYRYTREDGWSATEDAWWYFTGFQDFPLIEKQALRSVRGRVLDVGCGAGRHALYLQRRGHLVTGIETSARVAAIARARGAADVRLASACQALPFAERVFDTVLLFGNNLGLCGSTRKVAEMLSELARVTTPHARLLATTLTPGVFDAVHVDYWMKALAQGRDIGVMRFKLTYRGRHAKDVTLIAFAPPDLMRLAWRNGWAVKHIYPGAKSEDGYAVVMEKRK